VHRTAGAASGKVTVENQKNRRKEPVWRGNTWLREWKFSRKVGRMGQGGSKYETEGTAGCRDSRKVVAGDNRTE